MSKRKDVYILMRIYFGGYMYNEGKKCIVENKNFDSEKFYSDLKRAISSVEKNRSSYKDGRILIIINDDTLEGKEYKNHIDRVKAILEHSGFKDSEGNLYYSCSGGKGSSTATMLVREAFVEKSKNDDDIAITLDQDDELFSTAVRHISRKMPDGGMTISQFKIVDSNNLDITNDGGRQHNKLVKKNSCPLNRSQYTDCFYASTLGWTKSYTKKILKEYVKALNSFLDNERSGCKLFFEQHKAYEDFLDFYVFLLPDLKVGWVNKMTHVYYKHEESITSKPNLEDFQNHRTANLLALVDLAYSNRNLLREDFEHDLLRFLTVKMIQIESILKKYRHEYADGKNVLSDFSAKTHEGYFINKLARLATGINRGAQDKELFKYELTTRSEKTNGNITKLISKANDISAYHLKLTNFDLRYVLRKCVDAESALGRVKYAVDKTDENLYERFDKSKTPTQRRHQAMLIAVIVITAIILSLFFIYFLPCVHLRITWIPENISDRIRLVDVLIPLLVAIFTFFMNELSKLKIKASEEVNQKKLYYSEFDDLIRHLEANFKVMAQLRESIQIGKTPEPIHFDNLSWPVSSCLFSDDMAKIIGRDKVDDFSRLKVNLRNVNNSAHWLKEAFKDKTLSLAEQRKILDWELARYVGYLMNLYYMKDNSFSFPSMWQLDEYMEGSSQRNRLSGLFMYEQDGEARLKLAEKYIEKYLNDRREKRSVIIR